MDGLKTISADPIIVVFPICQKLSKCHDFFEHSEGEFSIYNNDVMMIGNAVAYKILYVTIYITLHHSFYAADVCLVLHTCIYFIFLNVL